jgi:hypothetical protein
MKLLAVIPHDDSPLWRADDDYQEVLGGVFLLFGSQHNFRWFPVLPEFTLGG